MNVIKFILLIIGVTFSFNVSSHEKLPKIDSLTSLVQQQSGIEKAKTQEALSVEYFKLSIFQQSLKNILEALQYYEENNLDSNAIHAQLVLGAIYEHTKKFKRAESYYLTALKNAKKYKIEPLEVSIYLNLGVLYSNSQQFDKSITYSKKALKKAKEIKDTLSLLRVYSNMSWAYFIDDAYTESMSVIDSGLRILQDCPKTDDYLYRSNSLRLNLSENLVKLNRNKEALEVLEGLLDEIEIMNLSSTADVYKLLSIVNARMSNYKSAYKYSNLEKKYLDYISQAINDQQLMELTVTNEIKYKEQENALNLSKKEIKITKERNKNRIMWVTLISILFVLIIFIIFYSKSIQKNKQLVKTNLEMLTKSNSSSNKLKITEHKKASSQLSDDQKNKIIDALETAFTVDEIYKNNSLTLQTLAKHLNTNRNYLSIVIKELNGSGFLDFTNEYRIKKSWTMLSDPTCFHLTIEHISKEVGFKSQPTFNKAFKKFTGVTPSFYLKEIKKNIKPF